MKETSPKKIKRIGDSIVENEAWWARKPTDLKAINLCKYQQHEDLKKRLLDTGNKPLWEATGDKYWGIGVFLLSQEAKTGWWRGENRFGKILVEIRREIRG